MVPCMLSADTSPELMLTNLIEIGTKMLKKSVQKNTFENGVCITTVMLFGPRNVNWTKWVH